MLLSSESIGWCVSIDAMPPPGVNSSCACVGNRISVRAKRQAPTQREGGQSLSEKI